MQKRLSTCIYSQKSVSLQPRTSRSKFADISYPPPRGHFRTAWETAEVVQPVHMAALRGRLPGPALRVEGARREGYLG